MAEYDNLIKRGIEAFSNAASAQRLRAIAHRTIMKIVKSIGNEKSTLKEKMDKVALMVSDEISKHVYQYSEKELIIVLLTLKVRFKSMISIRGDHHEQVDFSDASRHVEILYLIKTLLSYSDREYEGNSIIDNNLMLTLSFIYAEYLAIIKYNIESYSSQSNKDHFNIELENVIIANFFDTNKYDNYLNNMLKESHGSVPEEHEIKTPKLKEYLKLKGYDIETIQSEIDTCLYDNIGIRLGDIDSFHQSNEDYKNIVFSNYEEYIKKIKIADRNKSINFDNMLTLFSLNDSSEKELELHDIELRCIYKINDIIVFHPFDLCMSRINFEQFLMRNHYVEMYLKLFSDEITKGIYTGIKKIESKISTFISYAISEEMHLNGYVVPLDLDVPMAEIKNIRFQDGARTFNLLKPLGVDYGDIDILAADRNKKQIYNIEFKYYKPLIGFKGVENSRKTESRIKDIDKAIRRESLIKENVSTVLEFLKLPKDETYTVQTVIVSARQDYWLQGNEPIYYLTFTQLLDKIKERSL